MSASTIAVEALIEQLTPVAKWFQGFISDATEAAEGEEEESPGESDEIHALRQEYGYKLLAKDMEIEELQKRLRGMTRVLQMCYQAHEVLYDALYVSGKREM